MLERREEGGEAGAGAIVHDGLESAGRVAAEKGWRDAKAGRWLLRPAAAATQRCGGAAVVWRYGGAAVRRRRPSRRRVAE